MCLNVAMDDGWMDGILDCHATYCWLAGTHKASRALLHAIVVLMSYCNSADEMKQIDRILRYLANFFFYHSGLFAA